MASTATVQVMVEAAQELITRYGYIGLFGLLALGVVGVPAPDETLVAVSGLLIKKGEMSLVPTFLAAVGGSAVGVTISFVVGRVFGFRLIHRYGHLLHVTEERLGRFQRWYERVGRWTLVFGYFIPGIRQVTAFASGTSGLSWASFAAFAYSGAVLWVTTFLTAGYVLEAEWEKSSPRMHAVIVGVAGVGFAVVATYGVLRLMRYRRNVTPASNSTAPDE